MASIKTRVIPSFDPYDVKSELVQLAEQYFQIGNIDSYESGWLGYFIQSLTYMTSDMMFQNAMAYNEAFLTRALLPSSVYNIATQLDYKIKEAIPAQGVFTMIIPMDPLDMLIKFPAGSRIMAEDIPYKTKYTYYVRKIAEVIEITGNSVDSGKVFDVAYKIELHEKTPCIVFNMEMLQMETYYHEFTIENSQLYVFYEEKMSGYSGDIYDILVAVDDERYHEVSSIYQATSDERAYEIMLDSSNKSFTTKFGNGVYGYLPKDEASGYIRLNTTLGTSGNILKEKAIYSERVINSVNGEVVQTLGTNYAAITNGYNGETLDEIKRHVIENISSAKRLVTEKDYQGFQGITGLTNLKALPILNRRDLVGNNITLYMVKMDDENYPIPTSTIPVELDEYGSDINKGTTITYNGIDYVIPFTLKVDDKYDYLIGRYIYNVTNMNITPKMFVKSPIEDVICGIRQIQARIYPNTDEISFNLDAYKLKSMDGALLSAKIFIPGTLTPIDAVFSKAYDDDNTVILSSDIIDSTTMPIDDFIWKVELYYDGRFYNTYRGTIKLFGDEVPIASNTEITATVSDTKSTYLGFYSMTFVTEGDTCYFKVPITRLLSTTPTGETIVASKIYPRLSLSGNEYEFTLTRDSTDVVYFKSEVISIENITTGALDWQLSIDYNDDYYNVYGGTTVFMTSGRRFYAEIINKDPELEDAPAIDIVRIGLNNINVTSDINNGDYTFHIEVSKMPRNNPNLIGANLYIGSHIYNFIYVGETQDQTVTMKTPSIAKSAIGEGSITFRIEIIYDGETLDTYKQSAIFQTDLTPICYSNIKKTTLGKLMAYGVPVIEKTFYQKYIDSIDTMILGELASYRESFTDTKMLTDKIIIKFANTFGKSKNMVLNKYYPSSEMVYNDDFTINIAPTINIDVYISRKSSTIIPVIIEECKNVLYTFLTLGSNFHKNIYRSELARFLHDVVDDVEFCIVNEPTTDIVYDFSLDYIPKSKKELIYEYCPEYIWFDKDKITINVKMIN